MGEIRIAGVVRQSIVDGPGLRLTVFTQGCPHHCIGCHNPETHSTDSGYLCHHEKLLDELTKNPLLSGVTLSGGEPFCQAAELLPLAEAVKAQDKSLWIYSGYTFDELQGMAVTNSAVGSLLRLADVLVDGPYVQALRDLTLKFRGSANQRIIDVQCSLQQGIVVLFDVT